MFFTDNFLQTLPEEPNAGIVAICKEFLQIWDRDRKRAPYETTIVSTDIDKKALVLEALALISTYSEANNLEIKEFQITAYDKEAISKAHDFVLQLQNESEPIADSRQFEQYRSLFATKLGTVFHYEFSEGDLSLIQNLINKLRELISTTDELGEDHRHRLVKKLEKVQSELHKKVSSLDQFWGFCIDLSIVVGLMGKNAEPAADLVKKIVAIIWPTQTRAYQLSSSLPFKLLGQSEDDKSKDDKSKGKRRKRVTKTI